MLVKRKLSHWRKIGLIVLLALILAGAGYIVFYSPVFKIADVNVAIAGFDAQKTTDLIGRDPRGQNLIFWSPADSVRIYPEIKDLKITKDYFNRSIEITGSIRDKKIVWCFGSVDKQCFWTDETGYIFSEAPDIEGALLRVVNDYRAVPLGVGDMVLSAAMFNNLKTILNILVGFNLPIANVNIENLNRREFTVNLESGPKMSFSLEANPAFVKTALASLIKSSTWKNTKTLNLTVEGRVYQGF